MYIAGHRLRGCGHGLHWGDVAGSKCAVLGRGGRQGLARHGMTWWGLGVCWVGVADGRGWWWLGLACHVEATWWGLGVCWVGVAWQDGGAGWRWHTCMSGLQSPGSCVPCWDSEVGWRWQGVEAGWRWLACTNGLQCPGFACRVWVAQRVGGGGMLQAMSGQRVGVGMNGSGLCV
ncbi:hypothetical protein EDB83DRAFT_2310424 [Lactarius deliciosus]|nr:hypothetical protein EDB83DRAFT_2310424 [Lactarius deliciosus]